jgi:hypothetical protein
MTHWFLVPLFRGNKPPVVAEGRPPRFCRAQRFLPPKKPGGNYLSQTRISKQLPPFHTPEGVLHRATMPSVWFGFLNFSRNILCPYDRVPKNKVKITNCLIIYVFVQSSFLCHTCPCFHRGKLAGVQFNQSKDYYTIKWLGSFLKNWKVKMIKNLHKFGI